MNGIYIVADRNYEYGSSLRKLVVSPKPKTIAFGKAYSYEKAIKTFNGLLLEGIHQKHSDGFELFVYNLKLGKLIAVPSDALVLSEQALEFFLKGTKTPYPDKKIIFTDYSFELGNAVEFIDVPKTENLQMQIGKLISDKKINFIKINTINFYEDGAIGVGKIIPHYLFSKDVLISREKALLYFEKNIMAQDFLRRCVDDVYVSCQENNTLQRVPEKASFISLLTLKKWATE